MAWPAVGLRVGIALARTIVESTRRQVSSASAGRPGAVVRSRKNLPSGPTSTQPVIDTLQLPYFSPPAGGPCDDRSGQRRCVILHGDPASGRPASASRSLNGSIRPLARRLARPDDPDDPGKSGPG